MKSPIGFASAFGALALAFAASAAPAAARDSYVTDGAALFSTATVAKLNSEIGDFHTTSGKEIVVITVPSLDGAKVSDAVEQTFSKEQVNGVLFYFAKAEKQDAVVGDTASKSFFPQGTFENIHDAMRGYLRDGDADQAILTGVSLALDQYRGHASSLGQPLAYRSHLLRRRSSLGGGMSLFWLVIVLIAGFALIRALFRAIAGPRMMPPGYGQGGGYGPGYGPGAPGMGPGYGYGGGGGGSFFSGLLGGLGGAWLGNELFGGRGGGSIDPSAGMSGMGGGNPGDAGGFQSDPGQVDMGGMGGGGWGDGGGGFDSGGGGGDFGGGGGDGGGGGGW